MWKQILPQEKIKTKQSKKVSALFTSNHIETCVQKTVSTSEKSSNYLDVAAALIVNLKFPCYLKLGLSGNRIHLSFVWPFTIYEFISIVAPITRD